MAAGTIMVAVAASLTKPVTCSVVIWAHDMESSISPWLTSSALSPPHSESAARAEATALRKAAACSAE